MAVDPASGVLLVGAPQAPDNDVAPWIYCGAVYRFDAGGRLMGVVTNPLPVNQDRFGRAIAVLPNGQFAVGARLNQSETNDPGVVYLYGPTGDLQRTLNPIDPGPMLEYGSALAAVGTNCLLVGAPGGWGGYDRGNVYVYSAAGDLSCVITNPEPRPDNYDVYSFGSVLAPVDDHRFLVGAPRSQSAWLTQGLAYLYDTQGQLLLTFTNPATSIFEPEFGYAVTAWGSNRLAISAHRESLGTSHCGIVYVYDLEGALLQTITNPAPVANDLFGNSLSALGDQHLVVGLLAANRHTNAGMVHVFGPAGDLLVSMTGTVRDAWLGGSSVALGTNLLAISAPGPAYPNHLPEVTVYALPRACAAVEVLGTNGASISAGDTEPQGADGTDFGLVTGAQLSAEHFFTITNSGDCAIELLTPRITGSNSADFVVSTRPDPVIPAGTSGTFGVRFSPRGPALRQATVSVLSTASNAASYDFVIQGSGAVGRLVVLGQDGSVITSDYAGTSYEAGNYIVAPRGDDSVRVFTLTNSGTETLHLEDFHFDYGIFAGDFSVLSAPTQLEVGATGSLVIRLNPATNGIDFARLNIFHDQMEASPFILWFFVQAVEAKLVLYGGSSYSSITNGTTTTSVGQGTDMGNLPPGQHSLANFMLYNSGGATLTLHSAHFSGAVGGSFYVGYPTLPFKLAPYGTTSLGIYAFPTNAGPHETIVSLNSNDPYDNPFTFALSGHVTGAQLTILGTDGQPLAPYDDTPSPADGTDWGDVQVRGGQVDHVFSVTNSGNAAAMFSVTSGGFGGGFSLVSPSSWPITLDPGSATNFVIRFDPSFTYEENVYVGIDSPAPLLSHPGWFKIRGRGMDPEIDVHWGTVTNNTPVAFDLGAQTIKPISLDEPIQLQVALQSMGSTDLAIESAVIESGDTQEFRVAFAPTTLPPSQYTTLWVNVFTASRGERLATVRVDSNDGDENPFRFGIRYQGVGPDLLVLGIDGDAITNGEMVTSLDRGTDFGLTTSYVDRVFTITNRGDQALTFWNATVDGAAFSVQDDPWPGTSIMPGGVASFTIRFVGTEAGPHESTVALETSDLLQTSYVFAVRAELAAARMEVRGPTGESITNAAAPPSAGNGTEFGPVHVDGPGLLRAFTVTNSGTADLTVWVNSLSGSGADQFAMVTSAATVLAPGGWTNIEVLFNPLYAGQHIATVNLGNSDTGFTFAIGGEGIDSEIAVRGEGVSGFEEIVAGDDTPSTSDGTDFGAVRPWDLQPAREFRIDNLGISPLQVSTVVVVGADAAAFVLTQPGPLPVPAGSTSSMWIQFVPTNAGARQAVVQLHHNDEDEDPFEFAIQGIGLAPEIGLLGTNGETIANGDFAPDPADGTDFGVFGPHDAPVTHAFALTNSGSEELLIQTVQLSAGNFAPSFETGGVVPPGGVLPLLITYYPEGFGWGVHTALLSVASTDPQRSPYQVALTARIRTPVPLVLGPPGLAITNNDFTPDVADGSDFGGVVVTNGFVDRVFVITNAGDYEVFIYPLQFTYGPNPHFTLLNGFDSMMLAPGATTEFTVRFDPTNAGPVDVEVSFFCAGLTTYQFRLGGTGLAPVLRVLGGPGGEPIPMGWSTPEVHNGTDLGFAPLPGGVVDGVFVITNAGNLSLHLDTVVLEGPEAAEFDILQDPSGVLPAGAATGLTVRFHPSAPGLRSAWVRLVSDDSLHQQFTFAIQGAAAAPGLAVLGTNGAVIAAEDAMPSRGDGTDLGAVRISGSEHVDRTFSVTNSGASALSITAISFEDGEASDFALVSAPATALAPGEASPFTVRFDPSGPGSRFAWLRIDSTDPEHPTYRVRLRGDGEFDVTIITNQNNGYFGYALARLDDDRLVVGSPFKTIAGQASVGEVQVYDRVGTLLQTITNPAPTLYAYFGNALAVVGGDTICVAAPGAGGSVSNSGRVYLYGPDGSLRTVLGNPTEAAWDQFGSGLAAVGHDRLLVAASSDDANSRLNSGIAYLYHVGGRLLQVITNPVANYLANVGGCVAATEDGTLFVQRSFWSSQGYLERHDADGHRLSTVTNPTPPESSLGWAFGLRMARAPGDRLIATDYAVGPNGENHGRAYLYDSSGLLLTTITNPAPVALDYFGWNAAGLGEENLVISMRGYNRPVAHTDAGGLFLTDLDGNIRMSITNPMTMSSHGILGTSLEPLRGDAFAAGEPGQRVFIYSYSNQPSAVFDRYVCEGSEGAVTSLAIRLSYPADATVQVAVVAGATSAAPGDYQLADTQIVFVAAGPAQQELALTLSADAEVEDTERITLRLAAVSGALASEPRRVVVDILDDDGGKADLSLAGSVSVDALYVGETAELQLVVSNAGPHEAFGTVVTQDLPAAIIVLSGTSNAGALLTNGQTVVWSIGALPSGASASASFSLGVTTTGLAVVRAMVSSEGRDPRPVDNRLLQLFEVADAGVVTFYGNVVQTQEETPHLRLWFRRDRGYFGQVSFEVGTTSLTALADVDYAETNFTVTVPNGGYAGSINLSILDDSEVEGPEVFAFRLFNPTHHLELAETNVMVIINEADSLETVVDQGFDSGSQADRVGKRLASGDTPPAGWQVLVHGTAGGSWRFDDPAGRGNRTGGAQGFAIADSRHFTAGPMDTELRSPAFDLSGLRSALLRFKTDLVSSNGPVAEVDVSTDDGAIWSNVWQRANAGVPGPQMEFLDISRLAAGQPAVKVRFHYRDAMTNGWWQVDEVSLAGEADGDGDGMPDWWEEKFFGAGGTEPGHDSDGDGLFDRDEYIVDTIPTNGLSSFAIEALMGPPPVALGFPSSPLVRFDVEAVTNGHGADWTTVSTNVPGGGVEVSLPGPGPESMHLYRVRAHRP